MAATEQQQNSSRHKRDQRQSNAVEHLHWAIGKKFFVLESDFVICLHFLLFYYFLEGRGVGEKMIQARKNKESMGIKVVYGIWDIYNFFLRVSSTIKVGRDCSWSSHLPLPADPGASRYRARPAAPSSQRVGTGVDRDGNGAGGGYDIAVVAESVAAGQPWIDQSPFEA